jgi:hypothetical protein
MPFLSAQNIFPKKAVILLIVFSSMLTSSCQNGREACDKSGPRLDAGTIQITDEVIVEYAVIVANNMPFDVIYRGSYRLELPPEKPSKKNYSEGHNAEVWLKAEKASGGEYVLLYGVPGKAIPIRTRLEQSDEKYSLSIVK